MRRESEALAKLKQSLGLEKKPVRKTLITSELHPEAVKPAGHLLSAAELQLQYPAAFEYFAQHTNPLRKVQMMVGHDEWVRLPSYEEKLISLIELHDHDGFDGFKAELRNSHFGMFTASILLACNNEGDDVYTEAMTVPEIHAFMTRLGLTFGLDAVQSELQKLKRQGLIVEVKGIKYISRENEDFRVETLPGYFTDTSLWEAMAPVVTASVQPTAKSS